MTTDTAARLRAWSPALAVAAIVALTAGVLLTTGRDDTLAADAGLVVPTPFSLGDDTMTSSLRLPFGVVDVAVTAAADETPSTQVLRGRRPPEDGSFVGVQVAGDPQQPLPQPTTGAAPAVRVALIAGGRTYPIAATRAPVGLLPYTSADRRAWVAVAGVPRDVRVAITFDGVTQTVEPRTGRRVVGRAAPLYDLVPGAANTPAKSVDDRTPTSLTAGFTPVETAYIGRCTVTPRGALPYLPGRGWAPDGQLWSVFELGVDRGRFALRVPGADPVLYRSSLTEPRISVALDGRAPTAVSRTTPYSRAISAGGTRVAVVAVPQGTTSRRLTVTVAYLDAVAYSTPPRTAPSAPTVRLTWTVELP